MSNKKGFAVTVEGIYLVDASIGHTRGHEKKKYKIVVNVPQYNDSTLSLIKNRLLESAIRKFDPAYKTYVTHSITGVQALGEEQLTKGALTVNTMSIGQLINYVRGQKLPVAIHLFKNDILGFRTAIEQCKADKKLFLIKQKKTQEDYEVQQELQTMNPDVEVAGTVKVDKTSEAVGLPLSIETETKQVEESIEKEKKAKQNPNPENNNTEDENYIAEEDEQAKDRSYDPKEVTDRPVLTDGSEDFDRPDEAPYEDNIDDEVVGKGKVDEAAVLAVNEGGTKKEGNSLVNDL